MNSTELIKEALESYNNYEDGKFEKKSYMNGYYDARLKVSQMQLPVKPEICVHISKIDSGGSFIDSERLSKRFTEYNLIPQLETKINLISEDGQYLEQFEVIQIYYEVDKKLKIDIYLDEY